MDIERRKKELLLIIEQLEADIEQLRVNIEVTRNDIYDVTTEEDAKIFDETHDLETGLQYITII